jgi:CHASE3 domain sensor protein
MPHQTSAKAFTDAPLFRHFPRWAGALVAFLGLLVIASWYAHWQRILQLVPNTAPMQFNTALCFVLSGGALFLLTTPRLKIVPWLGGAVGLLTALTLLEYLTGWDLYIDLIFFKPWFQAATTYPGRMSPLAAASFVFIGTAIVLASTNQRWPHRLAGTGLLACIVGVIGLVALFGYAFGIESAYGWGAYSRMAVNTAIALLLLSSGLLAWAWQTSRQENFNFLRWLPVTGSVTLMIMIAFVSAVNMTELKSATLWRQHTMQVIFAGQSFLDNLLNLQLGVRGYVTLGDTNALASYQSSSKLEQQQFKQLVTLTRDNLSQQRRLKELTAAMDNVFDYDTRVIAIYSQQGFAGVSRTDATGESRAVFGRARDSLKAFSQEEQRLLDIRDATEQADSHNAARLLVFGSVLAAVLLIIGNLMASHEMMLRRRAEAGLQQALTDVKTLSGLIPICGWCKSVRSDKGFWQTVEDFVRTRTDATFSHGMCPTCAEKFKADILASNRDK